MPSPYREITCEQCGASKSVRSLTTRYCSKVCAGLARRLREPLVLRLAEKVRRGAPEECWPFTGTTTRDGYGNIGRGDGTLGTMLAHRAAYLVAHGALTDDEVLHSCDNPPCCNPAHLSQGTHAENMGQAARRGRMKSTAGERNGANKYPQETIDQVRALAGTMSQQAIADRFGMGQSHVSRIIRGINWRISA